MSDLTAGDHADRPMSATGITPERINAGFAAVALVLAAAMLCIAGTKLLNDPDTLWHIQVGRDIWASRTFPAADTYSHTFAGAPWIAKQWLSGVLLAAAYGIGGWTGIVILTAGSLLAAFALVQMQLARHLKPGAAVLIGLWCFAMSSSAFLARPHALALPVTVWFVIHVWNAAQNHRPPHWIALGALALWANLHGSFTLGFVAAGLAFAHFVVSDPVLARPRSWLTAELWRRGDLRRWIAFVLLCPVVACIHPYGWHAILSTLVIAENAALAHIQEWRAFAVGADRAVALHLLAGLVVILATPLRTSWPKAVFIAFVLLIYLQGVRFVYLLFLLPVAVSAPDIARAFPAIARARWSTLARWDGVETAVGRASGGMMIGSGAAICAMLALTVATADLQPAPRHYPIGAIDAARQAGASGPVMNSYGFGGALVFEQIPTFVDGRADRLFENGRFIADYIANAGNAEALAASLREHAITWTLLTPQDANVALLDADEAWTRLYADDTAIVHVRTGG